MSFGDGLTLWLGARAIPVSTCERLEGFVCALDEQDNRDEFNHAASSSL